MMHILCLGDSITDCGRIWENPPFGYGYVHMLEKNLHKFYEDISVTNAGVDGFTVSRLLENTKAGRYPVKGSIVTVLIGINDIGLMMNTNRTEGQKEDMLRKFLDNYEKLIGILIREAKKIILLEPFIFSCPEEFRLWIPYVKKMSEGIKKLAKNYGIQYVMLQSRLDEAVEEQGVSFITTDGIHLTENGHAILAETFLEAINRTDIVEEQKNGRKDIDRTF